MMQSVPLQTPFTILVDSMEKHPFRFSGLTSDARHGYRPLDVQFRWQALGTSNGDYSLEGFEPPPASVSAMADSSLDFEHLTSDRPSVSVERKSISDCIGTVLGWSERRDRFQRELANLARLTAACVIVEGTMGAVLAAVEEHGAKTVEENRKSLFQSFIAYSQDCRVPWFFCDDRRLAEVTCFRFLERFHRKHKKHK